MDTRLKRLSAPFLAGMCALFLATEKVSALELYTLFQGDCVNETGFITGVEKETVQLLNLDGRIEQIKRDEVRVILVYNLLDNPIASLKLDADMRRSLRQVRIADESNTEFIGWPIQFFDDLIIFIDTEGKTHVVNFDTVSSFSNLDEDIDTAIKPISYFREVELELANAVQHCKTKDTRASQEPVVPTVVIAEKIQVDNFFSAYATGFRRLSRFQRKIQFFAVPYLYDKRTFLGLSLNSQTQEPKAASLPLFMHWSSGSAYNSQAEYNLGTHTSKDVPLVEAMQMFSTNVKASFFSGSFIGNMACMESGSSCLVAYDQRAQVVSEDEDGGPFSKYSSEEDHDIFSQFNYLALSGVGYRQYSIVTGFYYPTYSIWGNGVFREVLARSSSPIVRFKWTTEDVRIQATYSISAVDSNNPDKKDIELILSEEMKKLDVKTDASKELLGLLDKFSLDAQYLRIDGEYRIADLQFQLAQVLFQSDYRESMTDRGDYRLESEHFITSFRVRRAFGQQVGLSGVINYFSKNNSYESEGSDGGDPTSGSSNSSATSMGMTIEFFL